MFAAVVFALTALVRADDKVEPKIEGDHSAEDVAAIQKVVSDAVDEGWGKFDVAHTMAEYTPGAYWINAFGIEKEGKEEIEKFVTRIFAAPGMRNRKQVPWSLSRSDLFVQTLPWFTPARTQPTSSKRMARPRGTGNPTFFGSC
jgi:hypothetical protein